MTRQAFPSTPARLARMAAAGLLLTGLLAGCMPQAGTAKPDMHTSRNSLDWAGTYEGVLPCADCPGIRTRLTLKPDMSFELSTQYIDRQPAPQLRSGRFEWNSAGNAVTLDGAGNQRFAVGEGRLLQMNQDGSAPPWNTPNRVLLRK